MSVKYFLPRVPRGPYADVAMPQTVVPITFNRAWPEAKKKLQEFWREVRYLITDEFCMRSRSFLATLSHITGIGLKIPPHLPKPFLLGTECHHLR